MVLSRIKWLFLALLLIAATPAHAEYRAYMLEVYDHIQQRQWDASTAFDPQQYIESHGGGNRLSVIIKATWMCWGQTARFKSVCKLPKTKQPLFQVGDTVKVTLSKHMTEGWKGTVELSLWREDLKSNVYGLRFGDKKQMYGRYYEFNLQKITSPKLAKAPTATNPEANQPATVPPTEVNPLNAEATTPGTAQ